MGDNDTGKTTRVELFLKQIKAKRVFYATDLVARINDREEYKRFLVSSYLPSIPSYLFIKRGDLEVLRYLKRRIVGQKMSADFIFSLLDRFKEEQEKFRGEIEEAKLVLSLFDGIVPQERSIQELRGDFVKAARVALLLEGVKTAQATQKSEPLGAFVGVLRTLGTRESLLAIPGKEDSWGTLREAVENSVVFALCQEARAQVEDISKKLRVSEQSERHFRIILYELLKQRVDERLLLLKPRTDSTRHIVKACRLLVEIPSLDALVVDHVAWDPKTLAKFLKYTAGAPCSVLVTSTVPPEGAPEEWLLASTR